MSPPRIQRAATISPKLRIGSWPGYGWTGNDFIGIFLDGLAANGCAVTSLENIRDIGATDLDVIILHWAEKVFWRSTLPESYERIRLLLRWLDALPGHVRVVWMVHNLAPHDVDAERGRIWSYYATALSARVDAALTLSPGTVAAVRRAFPGLSGKPVSHIWLPSYPGARMSDEQVRAARARRGIADDARVIGYCGLIRGYKGIDQLVQSFSATLAPDLRLLIAGKPSGTGGSILDLPEAGDARMIFDLRNLSRDEFNEALACCDLFVAPFRSYLHSASLVHALSAGRAVLTPRTAFAESLQRVVGPDWVRLYDNPLSPAMLEAGAMSMPPLGEPDLSEFQMERVGAEAVKFLRGVMAGPGNQVVLSAGR